MKLSLVIVLATACAHRPPPAAPVAPLPSAAAPVAPLPSAPAPAATARLSASPAHRVLEWLVDVITHRKGEVSRDEMALYCGPGFLGPAAGTTEYFHNWASEADGAVLEGLEVDDPTYVRGYLAARGRRWKLIIEIDQATSKLTYVRFQSAP